MPVADWYFFSLAAANANLKQGRLETVDQYQSVVQPGQGPLTEEHPVIFINDTLWICHNKAPVLEEWRLKGVLFLESTNL